MMFDEAYKARSTDVLPGLKGDYKAPERFEHGEATPVSYIGAQCEDGLSVVVWETRMPARFFRIEAYSNPPLCRGRLLKFALETGTIEPRLVAEIANAIAEGMLGVAR